MPVYQLPISKTVDCPAGGTADVEGDCKHCGAFVFDGDIVLLCKWTKDRFLTIPDGKEIIE